MDIGIIREERTEKDKIKKRIGAAGDLLMDTSHRDPSDSQHNILRLTPPRG